MLADPILANWSVTNYSRVLCVLACCVLRFTLRAGTSDCFVMSLATGLFVQTRIDNVIMGSCFFKCFVCNYVNMCVCMIQHSFFVVFVLLCLLSPASSQGVYKLFD